MRSQRYIVLDLETTGFSPARGDRIIEIGAVVFENGAPAAEFHTFIDPGRPIPAAARRVHGITDAMVRGQPPPQAVLPRFHEFLGNAVLVGHNAVFDLNFLRHEFGRLGLGLPNPHQCTLKLCRQRFPHLPNHRLETVAQHLFGPIPAGTNLHRALDDARLTAKVWMAMSVQDPGAAWAPARGAPTEAHR